MTIRTLLVGPRGHGGEEVYLQTLRENAPPEVEYRVAGSFHQGAPGAPCRSFAEIALNRIVHPLTIPDMGMRALRLRDDFDLVHVHAHPVHLSQLRGTPLVMSEGSSSAVYLGEYLGWDADRLRRGYRRTRQVYRALGIHDRLLALDRVSLAYVFSHWAREINLRWGADPDKLTVLHPGFPVPDPIERTGSDTFNFLFVGTDFERKGGFEVVEAFDRIAREHSKLRLTLVSDPWKPNPDRLAHSWVSSSRRQRVLERLRKLEDDSLVERRNAADRTTLLAELYPDADVFVMPSLAEGFGFTNVEAMSVALPVISSDIGPMREVVEQGETGILVPPGDVDRLAQAMERLVAEPDSARAMGAAGRTEFLERFTINRFKSGLREIYERALER